MNITGMIWYSIVHFFSFMIVLVVGAFVTIICPPIGIFFGCLCLGFVFMNWIIVMCRCLSE